MSPNKTTLPQYTKKYGKIYSNLKLQVDNYFATNKISKTGGTVMEVTAFISLILFVSVNIHRFNSNSLVEVIIFSILSGLLIGHLATLGHEATHNTLSDKKWINNMVNKVLDLIGFSTKSYRSKHSIHHNFTNVAEVDPDLDLGILVRTHQNQSKYWFHSFQQLYVPFLYAVSSLHLLYNPSNFNSLKSIFNWILMMLPHFCF